MMSGDCGWQEALQDGTVAYVDLLVVPGAVEQVAVDPLPASFEQAAVLGGGAALAEMLRHRLFPTDLISTVSVLYHDYEDCRP